MEYPSFLVVILVIFSANSATFDIKSVSTCTQQSQQGYCTRWQQNGSVQETTGCFPSHTQVYILADGQVMVKKMEDLQVGELVLSLQNKKQQFSKVIGWLHRNSSLETQFIQIQTTDGSFMATAMHNMALDNGSYAFAQQLEGQILYGQQKVQKIRSKKSIGVYSPLTQSGNFFVKVSDKHKALAHCYAYIRNPEYYERPVSMIFKLWEYIYGKQNNVQQIHPAAQWMRAKFDFLLAEK